MLGWEFPPFISGGLGTACYGLTKALDRQGVPVTFVLPKPIDASHSSHVTLISPEVNNIPTTGAQGGSTPWAADDARRSIRVRQPIRLAPKAGEAPVLRPTPRDYFSQTALRGASLAEANTSVGIESDSLAAAALLAAGTPPRVGFMALGADGTPSGSYALAGSKRSGGWSRQGQKLLQTDSHRSLLFEGDDVAETAAPTSGELHWQNAVEAALDEALPEVEGHDIPEQCFHFAPVGADYAGNLLDQADRYAQFCVAAARHLEFDVVHAHDWLTYPAGIALARLTGKPLVVHVHSTEFDRSGESVNQPVYNIERRGMHAAVRCISVSMLTKNLCLNRYGISPDKIDVVYNGVDLDPSAFGHTRIERNEKIVLYFGRITLQKGPEYFVRAAKRVLEVMKDVRFIVAGSGDQATHMIEMAAALGIGSRMTFTGFLRGQDIPRMFSMADVYVMPSVSEPFGIAPLEAIAHRVPVIISRSSGVSEVLTNALKVDFWDVDDIANKIVAVLRHPPLRNTLRDHGLFEIRGINWDGAAQRCLQTYHRAIEAVRPVRSLAPH